MEINKKNIIIGLIAVFIAVIGISLYAIYSKNNKNQPRQQPVNTSTENSSATSVTKAPVPKDIKIPEQGEKTSENVATPTAVTEAAPGASAKYRSFDIKGEGGLFVPSTVIVKKGDTVHVNFNAVDKAYDIIFPDYGMKQSAEKGQTKILEFQALDTGKFTYYCETCGGLDSNSKGYIIVAE